MPDFNIDDFKQAWQKQEVSPKYDNTEILKMLNKKSRNYVKYIFWISVIEFLLILSITIFYLFSNDDVSSLINMMERIGVERTENLVQNFNFFYLVLKLISLAVTAYFVVRFLVSYRKIQIESNLKKFILQIVQFKKTVNLFIFANIALLIASTLALAGFVMYTINSQSLQLSQSELLGFIVGLLITIVFSLIFVWIYYRLVYGIILKRLGKNLEQLKEIETNQNEEV